MSRLFHGRMMRMSQRLLAGGPLRSKLPTSSWIPSRGFRTTSVVRGGGGGGRPVWELGGLPPMMPRRYNEDIRKRSGLDPWDENPTEPLNFDYEIGEGKHDTDESSFFGGYVCREMNDTYFEVIGGFLICIALLFGPVTYYSYVKRRPYDREIWIPDAEIPLFRESVVYWDRVVASNKAAGMYLEYNPYTDYKGDNPMYLKNYTPDERPPTLAEAYPNGW